MRLAVSNLAWRPAEEAEVARVFAETEVAGVEIAPTLVWPEPAAATAAEIRRYRGTWEERGVRIVALQSLLFARPDLTLFESADLRGETLAYLGTIIRLAAALGAGVVVFGSPKNRRAGSLARGEVDAIARDFFRSVGEAAAREGVTFCIEPNPPAYGCDFVTSSAEGAALVRAVAHPGFGLHLDAAGLTLAEEPVEERLAGAADVLRHFHVSEVNLDLVGRGSVPHARLGAALRRIGYSRWVSIEMKSAPGEDNAARVRQAVRAARSFYLDAP